MARFGRTFPIKPTYKRQAIVTVVSIGPSNLKTMNGLAKASIKTVEQVTLANIKTTNGLT